HQFERIVYAVERHGVGDQVVDVDLSIHVPVDDSRYVGAASCSAEGRTAPNATGDQLEGTRRDFLAGTGDADDHALAPAFVAALEGLAHGFHIADAFEAVVSAAPGQFNKVADKIARNLVWIDEMGQAEFARQR